MPCENLTISSKESAGFPDFAVTGSTSGTLKDKKFKLKIYIYIYIYIYNFHKTAITEKNVILIFG